MRKMQSTLLMLAAAIALFGPTLALAKNVKPASSLLTPDNAAILLIDQQESLLSMVKSHDQASVKLNVVTLAHAAKEWGMPIVLSTVSAKQQGPMFPEVTSMFPNLQIIDRSTLNSMEDQNFIKAVEKTGRKKIIISGLFTEICVAFAALTAKEAGYEVYVVTDASGGTSLESHTVAMDRMLQNKIVPMTTPVVIAELIRDWKSPYAKAGMNVLKDFRAASEALKTSKK